MPILKLTKRNVEAIEKPCGAAPVFYWDEDLKGFGLRLMPSGVATWIVEYRPGAGGRGVAKKRVKIGRLDKLEPDKAREAAKKILAGVELGADPAKTKAEERGTLVFSQLAATYVEEHMKMHRKSATADYYTYVIEKHLNQHIGSKRANTITHDDVGTMHRAIGKAGGKYIANRALAVASAVFNWAKMDNPAKGVRKFKEDGRERFLTSEELQRLGDAMREAETIGLPYDVDEDRPNAKHARKRENRRIVYGPHAVGAIRLLMLTGCRLREILNLRWNEVDLGRGMLFLPDSKTGKKPVMLPTAAQELLRSLPRIGNIVIAGRDAGTDDEAPRHDIKKPWAAILKRAGLSGIRIHDLRHTFGSVGAGSGLGLPVIGNLLGHKNQKTTERYAHVANDAAKRAADMIGEKISAALGTK
ncbi:site-specific integrase [Mesorhizobium sp. VK22B]|uniref:Site-specific integrase n=1 Tax=Mesorhizobium captivum TaxID=3072319 RepID=A0ABU4ZAB4_9HYPH|nr:site-specific integrase [Mesorhizobium sp. VK22B]MDX8495861.1 site-specific integrase [Mesorhizobium sp. VK22B]